MKKLDEINLIGFDVDGTLLDTLDRSFAVDNFLIKKYGGNQNMTKDMYRRELGNIDAGDIDWSNFYQKFGIRDDLVEEVEAEFHRLFDSYTFTKNDIIPGAEYIVEHLQCSKFVVSKQRNPLKLLERLDSTGLLRYFDINKIHAVRGSKTESINIETIMHTVNPKNVAYVGDSVTDDKYAKEAGANSIIIANMYSYCTQDQLTKAEPDILLESIKELYKVI